MLNSDYGVVKLCGRKNPQKTPRLYWQMKIPNVITEFRGSSVVSRPAVDEHSAGYWCPVAGLEAQNFYFKTHLSITFGR